ncbi:nucleotide pyrophosphatase/phosphodiesterase-like [Hordeum vulgare]|nr:nucleotide pyrophosphatase/phosphodiesterase-like [Hordeum vulgare]
MTNNLELPIVDEGNVVFLFSRDYAGSRFVYVTPDLGDESGVAYESYFPMPAAGKDKPWYSIEHGIVHFIVMSTEHPWSERLEQYNWMERDLSSVDRSRTPMGDLNWILDYAFDRLGATSEGLLLFGILKEFKAVDHDTKRVVTEAYRAGRQVEPEATESLLPSSVPPSQLVLPSQPVDPYQPGDIHRNSILGAIR